MTTEANVRLTIRFSDPNLDDLGRDEAIRYLMVQFKEVDGVRVSRVVDSNPPAGNKAAAGFLVDVLTADVNFANVKAAFGFLKNCLANKPIELEVEAAGRKLKVKANTLQELESAIKSAQAFIEG